jgi:predicted nucleotidyltransferase
MALNIEKKHRGIVTKILSKYEYSFFVFGSRAKAQCKKLSDLDLFYIEEIPQKIITMIEEEFEDSDLPYKVDLVNYNTCDRDFKERINKSYIRLQGSKKL